MKYGLALPNQFHPDASLRDEIASVVSEVQLARGLGFSAILAGEHRLSDPFPYCSPFPFLGRLAADAGDMLLVAMSVLPLHNPIDVAESGATLDAVSGGRFVLAGALGYRDIEYAAFGVERRTRVGRMIESMDMLDLLWGQESAEYHGQYYNLPQTPVCTRPVQPGGPPIWLAAINDAGVKRAADRGYPWLVLSHASNDELQRQTAMYNDAFRQSQGQAPAMIPMIQELVIAETSDAAWDIAETYLGPKYKAYTEWGQNASLPGEQSFEQPFRRLAQDRFIIGTPDQCSRAIERIRDTLGINLLFIHCHWPGLTHDATKEMIKLYAEEVAPAFATSA